MSNSAQVLDRIVGFLTDQEMNEVVDFLNARYRNRIIETYYSWLPIMEVILKGFFFHTTDYRGDRSLDGVGLDAHNPDDENLYFLAHDDNFVELLAVKDCPHYNKIMAAIIGEG